MSNNMSQKATGQKRQVTSTPIEDMVATARDAAQETSGALVRTASEGLDAAVASMQQVRNRLEDVAQGLPTAPTSTHMAWRAGRWLGRAEGVIWLASRGAGIWWGQTKQRLQRQTPDQRVRLILQWGPTTIASAYLAGQVWTRLRHPVQG